MYDNTLLTKTTAAQNEVALSYHKLRGLYFLAVVFAGSIICCIMYIYGVQIVEIHKHTQMLVRDMLSAQQLKTRF